MEPPAKKQKKVLWDDDSSDEDGGVSLNIGKVEDSFQINEEYAKRFEYNKKREELARLEEKHGKSFSSHKNLKDNAAADDEDEDEESSEEEDEEAELVTEALDSEIMATLNAIRNKDPRVYDANVKFYSEATEEEAAAAAEQKKRKEKSMTLKDYHRRNLMRAAETGKIADDDEEDRKPVKTFDEEQEDLKREVVREMHNAADADADSDDSDDGGFLIPKAEPPSSPRAGDGAPAGAISRPAVTEEDVANADMNPEAFLSNFMAARAWLPSASGEARFKPLESDDEEELARAERFEEAYNLRFEDPNKLNETLTTHDRELVKKYSVRREETSSRKKKREAERARREEEKREREVERARLRKLKIEQLEEKVEKIRKAAGLQSTEDVLEEDWVKLIDDDFGVEQFEEMMKKRFGEDYYAQKEVAMSGDDEAEEDEGAEGKKKKKIKVKKPKWEDDIDIKDLIPDFDDEEPAGAKISLSDLEKDEGEGEGAEVDADEQDGDDSDAAIPTEKRKSKKDRLKEQKEAQRAARKQRRKLEALVDQSLSLDPNLMPSGKKRGSRATGTFRYRETSPTSFGLSARDILLAEDRQLNQFAGLKKLAPFRDEERKRHDKKKLGKKARLREWRKETFGDEKGPSEQAFEEMLRQSREEERREREEADAEMEGEHVDIREGSKKKRKRSRKH